jgi:hypothetical protein
MVRYGGLAQAMMLPVISVAALYLRHRRLPPEAHPGPWHTAGLWVAAILICLVMVYYLALSLR